MKPHFIQYTWTSCISKSRWAICVKWDALNFLWFLFEINWILLFLYVEFNFTFSIMSQNFPMSVTINSFTDSPFFYFFGRSTDNWNLYVHMLILLKPINYCNRTAIAFLFVFLERKCFLSHSRVVCQVEFWWFLFS